MSSPLSPRVVRGAIVGVDILSPVASAIVFQYNPDTVTRTLQAQAAGDGAARAEAMRLKGAPIETIRLEAEIDATDQLAGGDPIALATGIYPQLSALEMLVYPKSGLVITNTALAAAGVIEVIPPTAPFTLLIWGFKRVVPVRVTDFSITEEAYDTNLNPIRAKVTLSLRVLSYNDLGPTHPGFYVFLTHQIAKEAFAVVGSVAAGADVIRGNVRLA